MSETLDTVNLNKLLYLTQVSIKEIYDSSANLSDSIISNTSTVIVSKFLKTKERYKPHEKRLENYVNGILKKIRDDYSKTTEGLSTEILDAEIDNGTVKEKLFRIVSGYVLIQHLEPVRDVSPLTIKDNLIKAINDIEKINSVLRKVGVEPPVSLILYEANMRTTLSEYVA